MRPTYSFARESPRGIESTPSDERRADCYRKGPSMRRGIRAFLAMQVDKSQRGPHIPEFRKKRPIERGLQEFDA